MLGRDARDLLSFLRVGQLPRFLRRAARLPAAAPGDFAVDVSPDEADALRTIAETVRGPEAKPAIFVHGVLPRSGTNFLADVLDLHPDVHAHPGRLWEFPLLYVAPGAAALQQEFLFMFKRNREVMGRFDMLAYLASGWLRALQAEAGDRRVMLKSPHVQGITLFPHLFPNDILLLCLRDGRDVIHSSLGTFGRRTFRAKSLGEMAREWRHGAEVILSFAEGGANAHRNALVVRYEAMVDQPEGTVRAILRHAGLDAERYDFDALRALPVRGSSASTATGDARWSTGERPKDFRPVGRWDGSWTDRQKARFKAVAGATLIRAGYASDSSW